MSETSADDSRQTSSGILSHSSQCNSPVTSGWESFCKGVNLADKKRERVARREFKQQEIQKKKSVQVNININMIPLGLNSLNQLLVMSRSELVQ